KRASDADMLALLQDFFEALTILSETRPDVRERFAPLFTPGVQREVKMLGHQAHKDAPAKAKRKTIQGRRKPPKPKADAPGPRSASTLDDDVVATRDLEIE